MSRLRLAVFTIIAVSMMTMGTSIFMVHAAKPEVVSDETSVDFCGNPICYTDPSPNPMCGVVGTVIEFDIHLTKTDYGQDKFKIVKTLKGDVYDSADLVNKIGFIDSKTTTQGHYEVNGATVLKMTDKVNCDDGMFDEFTQEIYVSNNGK